MQHRPASDSDLTATHNAPALPFNVPQQPARSTFQPPPDSGPQNPMTGLLKLKKRKLEHFFDSLRENEHKQECQMISALNDFEISSKAAPIVPQAPGITFQLPLRSASKGSGFNRMSARRRPAKHPGSAAQPGRQIIASPRYRYVPTENAIVVPVRKNENDVATRLLGEEEEGGGKRRRLDAAEALLDSRVGVGSTVVDEFKRLSLRSREVVVRPTKLNAVNWEDVAAKGKGIGEQS
jgi:hypothetical protein